MKLVKSRKFMIALIFAFLMTGLFWISANAEPVSAVTVTVQAEDANGGFIMTPKQITVTAGYASSVSGGTFSNASPATNSNPTVLDALFAAHADKYGTSFTGSTYGSYIGGSSSYITKMFGISAGSGYSFPSIMFAVNGKQPNDGVLQTWPGWGGNPPTQGYTTYAMNQSIIKNGDVVNFFFINSYHDLYTLIQINNALLFNLKGNVDTFNTSQTLYFKGYDIFTEGYLVQTSWNFVNLANARICKVSDGTVVGNVGSNGSVALNTLTLNIGYNYLTVKPPVNSTDYYIPIYFRVYKNA